MKLFKIRIKHAQKFEQSHHHERLLLTWLPTVLSFCMCVSDSACFYTLSFLTVLQGLLTQTPLLLLKEALFLHKVQNTPSPSLYNNQGYSILPGLCFPYEEFTDDSELLRSVLRENELQNFLACLASYFHCTTFSVFLDPHLLCVSSSSRDCDIIKLVFTRPSKGMILKICIYTMKLI